MSDIEDEPPSVLLPCTICSRTFRPEVLERHVKVCEKTASKKRRVFDSFKSRVTGTELEEFLGPAPLPGQAPRRPAKSPVKKKAPSKWKETHENLIATLRAARGIEPPPDTVMEPQRPAGNEQCPSCNRFFGPRAFDRHVEFCKEKTARIKLTPSKISQAQERLEARTKYRAPLSIKPKLTTKEKYSPMLSRKESSESCCAPSSSVKTSPPIPTISRNQKTGKQTTSNFSRQSPIRSSERLRSVSPNKKSLVSNSKPNAKNESQAKATNQPKIKESLKNPDDLRPKTGSKTSTQEKIRSSNLSKSQLEDETYKAIIKSKKKMFEKTTHPSGNESLGIVDNESSECRNQKHFQNKKNISENNVKLEQNLGEGANENREKIMLDLTNIEKASLKAKEEVKSGRNNKQRKPQINDLSVNDETFGIFVAACTARPPSSSASKTSLKTVKDSPKKKTAVEKVENKKPDTKKQQVHLSPEKRQNTVSKIKSVEVSPKTQNFKTKVEKFSKIPKPKFEFSVKKTDYSNKNEDITEVGSNQSLSPKMPNDVSRLEKIKKQSKKWRNITEIPTKELMHLSEDIDVSVKDEAEELSESVIWEIAGEQFLKDHEPNQSNSGFSVDSLNEKDNQNTLSAEVGRENNFPDEDGVIVLHVTDPAKLVENDADMKLSVSEPSFSRYSVMQKLKKKSPECHNVDIVVFTAFPSSLQTKIKHRKRKRQIKTKKLSPFELLLNREKTFLANDVPKAKRRKMCGKNSRSHNIIDLSNFLLKSSSKNDIEEMKQKFIENLKVGKDEIKKWQITTNANIQLLNKLEKGIDSDLKSLKKLSGTKKSKKRSSFRDFKQEKLKKIVEEREKQKLQNHEQKECSKNGDKKFEYFEISFSDDPALNKKECEFSKENILEADVDFSTQEKCVNTEHKNKKFECFEINNDICKGKLNSSSTQNKNERKSLGLENNISVEEVECLNSDANSDSKPLLLHLNNSLENIEEVDENVIDERSVEKDKSIEIEDFIFTKPNAQKILSKDYDCLDELFPKLRQITEPVSSVPSPKAIKLDFTTDSVYDLRSNEEKIQTLPEIPPVNSTRILQKRLKKKSQLPQILAKNKEQKENSMMSLIEVWKNKKGGSECEKFYKGKATLPTGKLPPLSNKNSFQIAVLVDVLKRKVSEIIEGLTDGVDSNDSYDPFKQAERQMLALMSWPSTADIKTAKALSPSPKSKPTTPKISNLETSPTSAFTKYPNKDDISNKNEKNNARKNLNETFAMSETAKKNNANEKPMYTAEDDWEQIFENHFDMNKNEMTEKMRSVKSALDGLLKNSMKNKSNPQNEDLSPKNKSDMQDSIITDVLYTSTPKRNSKSDKSFKSLDPTIDLDQTPNTYRKNSNFVYGRITPPEDFGGGKKNDKNNRNSGLSLSSLSFCSQISDTTLADEEVMRSNLEIIGKAAAAAAAKSPRRKYARSQSVFDERNKMLFAKTYDPNSSSSDENDVEILPKTVEKKRISPSRNPNPKSSPSNFHRSMSVMDGRCKGDGDHSEEGDHVSSPESSRNRKAKLSGDSAYSSLNRRSPRQNSQKSHPEDRLSSSGSDHSLPTVNDYDTKPKLLDGGRTLSPKKDQPVKMSKFCHECGSKYPVAIAKFCCECGVRRLII